MNNHLLVNKLDNLTLDKLKNICDAPVVLKLVKEIIKSKDAVDSDGSINVIVFAEYYAFALSKLVDNKETSDDYDDVIREINNYMITRRIKCDLCRREFKNEKT